MADADEEYEYVFQASGDACGICAALDGTDATPPAHDNCQCQTVMRKRKKSPGSGKNGSTYNYSGGSSSHYGSGNQDYTIGTEIEVECCDGSTIGESVPFDGHDLPDPWEDAWQVAYYEKLDEAAGELADGCPECDDGEELFV
jgi:hypothetical protein